MIKNKPCGRIMMHCLKRIKAISATAGEKKKNARKWLVFDKLCSTFFYELSTNA